MNTHRSYPFEHTIHVGPILKSFLATRTFIESVNVTAKLRVRAVIRA